MLAQMAQGSTKFDWNGIQVFQTLLECSSFKEAGKRLGVDASTVGRRLDALESAVGVPLFERSRGGVVPTDNARALVPAAQRFAQAAVGFAHATGALEERPAGEVRITAPTPVANHLLAPLLPELHERYPDLRIIIDTTESITDLDLHRADLALRGSGTVTGLPGGETLLARKLWSNPCVPVANTAYAAELETLTDLADARWVTFGERTSGFRWARMVLDHVPESRIVLRTDDTSTLLSAIACGVGASWINRSLCTGDLVEIPLGPAVAPLISVDEELWLVCHRGLRRAPRVEVVWSFLLGRMKEPALEKA